MENAKLDRLKRLGAATLHEAQGQKGALDSGIKPLDPSARLAGPAYTVELRPSDNLALHYALAKAAPGDVLVVDAKGFLEAGPWGDVMTAAAQARGIAGLVIDGAVRDGDAIIESGFPVFCRGLSIKGTLKNQPGRVDVQVAAGGQAVNPGDMIVGDRDGVVVVTAAELDAVLVKAEERERKEEAFKRALREGRTTVELLDLDAALKRIGLGN